MDAAAKREWRLVTRACATWPTWLQAVDVAALTAYCVSWSTFLAAAKDVAERGPLVPGRSSADAARDDGPALVKNPSVQIARDAQEQLRKWATVLGFTPDARGKVDLGDYEAEASESDLLSG
ncbi:MAG: phage terminase small subunit P27 family [Dehalococcoidia bacterium]